MNIIESVFALTLAEADDEDSYKDERNRSETMSLRKEGDVCGLLNSPLEY